MVRVIRVGLLSMWGLFVAGDAPAADLEGVVMISRGYPASGVEMRLSSKEKGDVLKVAAGNWGRFQFKDVEPGPWHLRIWLRDFEALSAEVHVSPSRKTTFFLAVIKEEPLDPEVIVSVNDCPILPQPERIDPAVEMKFVGRVEGPEGPMADVEVRVYPCALSRSPGCQTKTDSSGAFELRSPIREDAAEVKISGFARDHWIKSVVVAEGEDLPVLEAHELPAQGKIKYIETEGWVGREVRCDPISSRFPCKG